MDLLVQKWHTTFFCVIITAEFSPLTATEVLPPPVAAFIAYSTWYKWPCGEKIVICLSKFPSLAAYTFKVALWCVCISKWCERNQKWSVTRKGKETKRKQWNRESKVHTISIYHSRASTINQPSNEWPREEKRIQRREKEGDEECFSFLLLL